MHLISFLLNAADCVKLVAFVSQHGLHGEFHFSQHSNNSILIESQLETTLQYPEQIWNWGVHQLPVDYSNPDGKKRCHLSSLGKRLFSFDDTLGLITLPGNESSKWFGNFELTGLFAKHLF